jgi:signal transduction histidine kinase
VEADKAQWNRVFNNLLKNAVQAIPEERAPDISVKVSVEENRATIEICDNGVGIDPAKGDKVFEPRFTTKSGGMGLGLAMVKRIVEQSSAQIRYESRLNKGTCFYVYLFLVPN